MKQKQIVLVAAINLSTFLEETLNKFAPDVPMELFGHGKVETNTHSYIFVSSAEKLRGFHGIEFEVWGPPPSWITTPEASNEIRMAVCR